MKVTVSKDFPKSAHTRSPCGCLFDFPWDDVCMAIQEYRLNHGYAKGKLKDDHLIGSVYVNKNGVTFVKRPEIVGQSINSL